MEIEKKSIDSLFSKTVLKIFGLKKYKNKKKEMDTLPFIVNFAIVEKQKGQYNVQGSNPGRLFPGSILKSPQQCTDPREKDAKILYLKQKSFALVQQKESALL